MDKQKCECGRVRLRFTEMLRRDWFILVFWYDLYCWLLGWFSCSSFPVDFYRSDAKPFNSRNFLIKKKRKYIHNYMWLLCTRTEFYVYFPLIHVTFCVPIMLPTFLSCCFLSEIAARNIVLWFHTLHTLYRHIHSHKHTHTTNCLFFPFFNPIPCQSVARRWFWSHRINDQSIDSWWFPRRQFDGSRSARVGILILIAQLFPDQRREHKKWTPSVCVHGGPMPCSQYISLFLTHKPTHRYSHGIWFGKVWKMSPSALAQRKCHVLRWKTNSSGQMWNKIEPKTSTNFLSD